MVNDLTQAGAAVYEATHQPHVERGFLRGLGEVTGIASDLTNIAGTAY